MPVQNQEIADIFAHVAALLEIEGANVFRVRAYQNAAQRLGTWPRSLADLVAAGSDLTEIPGIGKDLAEKIKEIVSSGRLELLAEMERKLPPGLLQMLRLTGLGPKRVRALYEKLHLSTLEDLKRAAAAGKVREVEGFGPKLEAQILTDIERREAAQTRTLLSSAEPVVNSLVEYLRRVPGVLQVTPAGSFRRRLETVGDVDLLATCRPASPVMDKFLHYEDVRDAVSTGETRSIVHLRSGLQVDLRVVEAAAYGAALHYFTGSKAHNIAVRMLGQKKKLKVNEYGVFRGDKRIAGKTEQEIYALFGLKYIEPELREMRGELEAARAGRLPRLIEPADIRGDLHAHTTASDGGDTLAEMAQAARAKGYEYLAITDHSQRVTVARGLDAKRLRAELEAIDRLNAGFKNFTLLKGLEVDILEDGSLDLADDVLAELDLTVCSVHSAFNLPREKQTDRILKAMDNPYFKILGHPTGRLLGEREAYAVDLERVIRGAKDKGCFLELNGQPQRLDVTDVFAKFAKDLGVKVAVSTDAHDASQLELMRFGVGQARRGWLAAQDVLNARPLRELKSLLRRS